jgi:VanZ family protein
LKSPKTALILPICWLIICTFLLTLPGSAFPKENWLDKLWVDKWVHIGLFSIMAWTWCLAMLSFGFPVTRLKRIFLIWALIWLAYGIGMEFVQKYLIPNRGFDVWDIAADGVGAAMGYFYSRKRYIKK